MMLGQTSVFKTIRAFSFGGLVTACLGAVIYLSFPSYFGHINPYRFITACGAVGTVVKGGIELLYRPVFKFLVFHERLFELAQLKAKGIINHQTYQRVVNQLVTRRFLEK
jgi:hypothetical protein